MIIKKKHKNRTNDEGVVSNQTQNVVEPEKEEDIDLFALDNIDFSQRQERRKGERRRGFRRIDDRNLISRAKEEADSIKETAAKSGYEDGLKAAQDDIERVKDAIEFFYSARQEVYDAIIPDIMEISLDIAKKIIKKEVSEDPEILTANIKEIFKGLSKDETKIMLKVNPSQASILKQEIPEMLSISGLEAKVMIIPDETMLEGGCLVTTTNGVIDATVETQLSIISEALKEL